MFARTYPYQSTYTFLKELGSSNYLLLQSTALFLAFYLLLGSCIPRSDYSQLGHLADLRAHFLEHQAEAIEAGETISFFDFLYIHFIDTNQHTDTNHEEDHQQLPLQSFNSVVSFILSADAFLDCKLSTSTPSFTVAYQNLFYLSGFLKNNMRPPSFL